MEDISPNDSPSYMDEISYDEWDEDLKGFSSAEEYEAFLRDEEADRKRKIRLGE